MIRLFLISFFILSCSTTHQTQLKVLLDLPSDLKEISAIEIIPQSNLYWMVNDSGNTNHLFGINKKGKIERKIEITNVQNHDWEDLASDLEGNLFIADTGNNHQDRKNLAFYKIPNPSTFKEDKIEAEIIQYYFPEQEKFPPKKKKYLFDVEATFYFEGYLYLITKNRSSKFDGIAKLYKIPAQKGKHAAQYLASFKTCDEIKTCQITAAAISPDQKQIALLGHDKVWLFHNFQQDHFFNGSLKIIELEHNSQKESLCFLNNQTLLIADEKKKNEGGNLYLIKL
ncbi:hypothetical protein UJ101_00674 [Flavobacteriaceae bacterium UJ101]|nr:hypothetical protein UJ101_00674 [Flavobacteriaceae bacterium UJ101]